MNKQFMVSALIGIALCSAQSMVHAADGTINFTGEIVAAGCDINGGATPAINVDLGSVSASSFSGVGATSSPTQFTLSLSQCPSTFTASMPLGRTIPDTWASFSASGGPHAPSLYQAGINGTLLKDKNLSYNLSEGYGTRGEGNSGNVNASWLGSAGQLGGGYTYSRQNKQLNYSVQGSLLGHAEGITLGQPLPGDLSALALVKAPGAAGVKINNSTGLYTDPRGYAVVRYLNAYRRTRVALDTTSLPGNVDIDSNVLSVVPGAGAVVLAPFDTRTGGRLLITLHYHGGLLPFGAMVNLDQQSHVSGIVDENGQVYLSGLPLEGVLHVRWEGGACQARYAVPPQDLQRVTQASAQCQ